MKHNDYLIVGSGLFAATFACRAMQAVKIAARGGICRIFFAPLFQSLIKKMHFFEKKLLFR